MASCVATPSFCPTQSCLYHQYLDAQRIHNLVTYLQELHSLGLANADHTTLLLNTYTKLKDVARLDSFIKTESRGRGEDQELPFDLVTAIRVCRQAGYFEHAGYLAKKYERHEDYLRIQIEDAGNFADALAYLRKLGPEAVCSFSYMDFKGCMAVLKHHFNRPKIILRDTDAQCCSLYQKRRHNS
jgi:hypothetical protein